MNNTQNGTNERTSEMLGPISCTIHSGQLKKNNNNPSIWSGAQYGNYSYIPSYQTPKSLKKRDSENFNHSINLNIQTPKYLSLIHI